MRWILVLALFVPVGEEQETRSYDLSSLVPSKDRPSAPLFYEPDQEIVAPTYVEAEDVANFLMRFPAAGEASFEVTGTTLRLEARKEVHDYVAGMIAAMRSRMSESIRVRGRFVKLASPEADPARGEVLAELGLEAMPGQRTSALALQQLAYVRGYTTQIATGAVSQTPTIRRIPYGARLDVHAASDGESFHLDVEGELVSVDTPIGTIKVADKKTVEAPVRRGFTLRTSVRCAPGETVLAAVARTDAGFVGLLVAADRASSGKPVALPRYPEAAFEHRFLDVSALVGRPDFAGPVLGDTGTDSDGGILSGRTFTLEEPKAAAAKVQEEIVDWVRSIRPESWARDHASLERIGPWLYVRNTPDVLALVEKEVKAAGAAARAQVVTTAWLVAPPKDWDRKGEPTAEAVAKLLKEGTVLGGGELRTSPGRLSHVQSRTEHVYVQRYESVVATSASAEEPIAAEWNEGSVLEARGNSERVQANLQWARLDEKRAVEGTTPSGGVVILPRGEIGVFPADFRSPTAGWRAESRRMGDRELVFLVRVQSK